MADLITLPRAVVQQALEALENSADQLPKPYSTASTKAITALRAELAQAEPVQRNHYRNLWPERNFCSRCGKRLADEGIHTCTPPQQAEPGPCDHCSSPLFAAVRCRVCGRRNEQAQQNDDGQWMTLSEAFGVKKACS